MKQIYSLRLLLLAGVLCLFSHQTMSQTYAAEGMVVTSNRQGAEVGLAVLKKGGNAIDAAVATSFAMAVTYPVAGNIGGGGFIVYMQANGETTTIDFREKAPLAATADMYLDEHGDLIINENHLSPKAIGVPGTVAGLYLAHSKYGSLSWADVIQPAIDLAEQGTEMLYSNYFTARFIEGRHEQNPEEMKYMNEFFRDDAGKIVEPGELWKQPDLAKTLRAIRDQGADGFYKGEVAARLAGFMKEIGGLITEEDLAAYEAVERPPVHGTFGEYDIYSMPPPSSGGVTLIEMLNMAESVSDDSLAFNSAEYYHYLAEFMRRAYTDRARYLGDPDFNPDIPLNEILNKERAARLAAGIDPEKASVSDSTQVQLPEGTNTTHMSFMDKDGNAVSLTYTLEYSYGSRIVAGGLGFVLNNEMGDFNPVPGVTTSTGLIGSAPNQIAPGKRMLSSMTPTIVAKDGKPYLVIGSPGGRTIINTVFQTVYNVLAFDMALDAAIEAPKIHHQWLPDQILFERDKVSPDTQALLRAMGHKLIPVNGLGDLNGILVEPRQNLIIGVSDSASPEGAALGY